MYLATEPRVRPLASSKRQPLRNDAVNPRTHVAESDKPGAILEHDQAGEFRSPHSTWTGLRACAAGCFWKGDRVLDTLSKHGEPVPILGVVVANRSGDRLNIVTARAR